MKDSPEAVSLRTTFRAARCPCFYLFVKKSHSSSPLPRNQKYENEMGIQKEGKDMEKKKQNRKKTRKTYYVLARCFDGIKAEKRRLRNLANEQERHGIESFHR